MYIRGIQNAIVYMLMVSLVFIRYPAVLRTNNWIIFAGLLLISMFFPAYNYKRTRIYGFKKRWRIHMITFLTVCVFSYIVSDKNLMIPIFYLILLIPEALIDMVLRLTKVKIPILDIGVMTSFIIGGILLIFYRYVDNISLIHIAKIEAGLVNVSRTPMGEFHQVVEYFKGSICIVIFAYSFFLTLILYLGIWRKLELRLNYSYYFIIIYIILFFLDYLYTKDNIYLTNAIEIIKITYIYNGILHIWRTIEHIYDRKIAKICVLISVILSFGNIFGMILLVIGVYKAVNTPSTDDALDDFRNLMVHQLDM